MPIKRNEMDARREVYVHEEPQTLATIVAELREDLKQFVQTRFQLLVAELGVKLTAWKTGTIAVVIALVFAWAAFLLLTGALVTIIAGVVGVFLSLVIVGVIYLAIAGVAAGFGYVELRSQRVPPERTLQVLKEDQSWLQNEAKSA